MSTVICRIYCATLVAFLRQRGASHEALRGDTGTRRARRACGDYAQGFASIAEGDQCADPAQLRRRRLQRSETERRGHRGGPAYQRAQGRPGQEAFRRGGHGSGPWRPSGAPAHVSAQGGRRVRGASGRTELQRAARGALAMVAAAAGGPGGGTRLHRQRVARDGEAGAKKTPSSRGGASAG